MRPRRLVCVTVLLVVAAVLSTAGSAMAQATTQVPPEAGGSWRSFPPVPTGFNATHVVAGPGGKVLLIAGSGLSATNFQAGTFRSYVWDPASGTPWRPSAAATWW